MFGWSFASSGVEGYEWIRHRGRVIGGLVDATVLEKPPRNGIWLNAVTVNDLEATVLRVEAANGRVIRAPQDIPGRGRMAVVADRDGAMLQLISGKARVYVEAEPTLNRWLWAELLAGDAKDAAGFYRDSFGYEIQPRNPDYAFLVTDGAPQAGIVTNPFEETSSVWIPFVRVDDPAALSQRAEALGGRVVLASSDDLRQGSLAVILDPDGAPLALQRWPVPDSSPLLGGTP
jgi:predicted enzyme related to lactoylglutathione lyase